MNESTENGPGDRPGSGDPGDGDDFHDEELRRRARDLPREIDPPRDLWPEIEARIRASSRGLPAEEREGAAVPDRNRTAWSGRGPLAVAAAAALAVIFVAALLLLQDGVPVADRTGPETGASPTHLAAEARRVEEAYGPTLAELRTLVESRELAPATRETLRESLDVIDGAIEEARAALEDDPAGPRALESLRRLYEAKVEVLRTIAARARDV